jgi:hypothetical protein
MNGYYGTRLTNGRWHNQAIPDRTTVRHAWAPMIELGREPVHDGTLFPYSGQTLLAWTLENYSSEARQIRRDYWRRDRGPVCSCGCGATGGDR